MESWGEPQGLVKLILEVSYKKNSDRQNKNRKRKGQVISEGQGKK